MPQITITISDEQENKIIDAIRHNRDFIIEGGHGNVDDTPHNFALQNITFTLKKCPMCKGTRGSRVLGGGGDYEDWPCPECRPEEYAEASRRAHGHGNSDSDAD